MKMAGEHKAIRHNQFNEYIYNEDSVHPTAAAMIHPSTSSGASFGALHSMNLFLNVPVVNGGLRWAVCMN